MTDADERAAAYIASIEQRVAYPDEEALSGLAAFDESWSQTGRPAAETLALLDNSGSPATTASNGPHYFGFVIGATLPAAAAAERLMIAWDQCASSFDGSPVAATLEKIAGRWVLEALDLPRESAVGFGTSATACGITCLSAGRRVLLDRLGWDFDRDGLHGAPDIRVIVPETAHVAVLKSLRVLGFGMGRVVRAPVDALGRVDPARLPQLDSRTILCLQAGEVNTGEFDLFAQIVPQAKEAGAWVHVDGAFGLWARTSTAKRHLTAGIDGADSWTVDGHKWLNTPYDGAMAICRDAEALAAAMNSDAAYSAAAVYAQKNLTLEFSRRARGVPIWAALRTLGREGVAA
ncbi:MAG: pyridoxal-dependent decarboxylase, partial [Pseudomonadota bacterium]|nr:pyridoxal-dependent decarboxylase [Pseudomonadota bacterium]